MGKDRIKERYIVSLTEWTRNCKEKYISIS